MRLSTLKRNHLTPLYVKELNCVIKHLGFKFFKTENLLKSPNLLILLTAYLKQNGWTLHTGPCVIWTGN